VEAELGLGDVDAAHEFAARLKHLAEGAAELPLPAAQAAVGLGKTAAARGDPDAAVHHFEAGLDVLPGDAWPLVRAALHLELARTQASAAPAEAVVNAQAALSIYQRSGAPEASVAAGLLRSRGVPVSMHSPPATALHRLSAREREVLALLAQGMSNPAIAQRLFITAKTAEHHVSSILGKLHLRNRAEAAVFGASFQLTQETMPGAPATRR
jgi:DNA-binding CsgD family transcriptional regulator